ncbi:hypothetical protein BHE74_00020570 [Ensete ventricosum]|nr:hypothetical protein BHE74_00020570 [Ensete ventricosum]
MGGSPIGLGGSTVESTQIPKYGRFNCLAWMASFSIPSANLLANSSEIPLHRLNPGPMLKLDLGPSSGCNSIALVIVSPVRC